MEEKGLRMSDLMRLALLLIVAPVSWMDVKAWEDMR
jgi:hypothetical protein